MGEVDVMVGMARIGRCNMGDAVREGGRREDADESGWDSGRKGKRTDKGGTLG